MPYKSIAYNAFLKNGVLECPTHGIHENWSEQKFYDKRNVGRLICRFCNKEKTKQNRKNKPFVIKIQAVKSRAKAKNIEFAITINEVFNMLAKQSGRCALSGILLSADGPYGWSIDRIDPSKGYTIDNIQIVAGIINFMKSDLSMSTFISMCNLISEKHKNV